MKLSINILTWNSEKYIQRCIEHCLKQEYNDYCINVIDNNSSDRTIDICKQFADDINIIVNKSNMGFTGGHNLGINRSNSEYILVLNPDVYLEPGYVVNIIKYLDANPSYGGAIGKIIRYTEDYQKGSPTNKIDTMGLRILKSRQFVARNTGKDENCVDDVSGECFGVDGMAPVYRKSMLNETMINDQYFDEDFFAYCEDQDLSWRCRLAGWKFAYINESIALHVRNWKPNSIKHRKEIKSHIKRMALKNHYLMIVKNDHMSAILRHSPYIFYRLCKILVYSLLFERSTLLTFYDLMGSLGKGFDKRKKIKAITIVSLSDMLNWYKMP